MALHCGLSYNHQTALINIFVSKNRSPLAGDPVSSDVVLAVDLLRRLFVYSMAPSFFALH